MVLTAAVALIVAAIMTILCIVQKRKITQMETDEEDRINFEQRKARSYIPKFIKQLEAADSLGEIFTLHIRIWGAGLRPHYIGPDKYGMYRTDDILTMTPSEVWLGAICGLNTHSAEFWEHVRESDPEAYKCVVCQYKSHLICNLKAM